MAKYPQVWMNVVATGIRVAALGSAAILTFYFFMYYKTTPVPQGADGMFPKLQQGREVLVKTDVRLEKLTRGDVVIFSPYPSARLISRVAGLPGEEISLTGGKLHVNGNPVPDYKYNTVTDAGTEIAMAPVKVDTGRVFVLNDNPAAKSPDSRVLGGISAASIAGVVLITF